MQVFKAFLKIMLKQLPLVVMYIAIFLAISIAVSSTSADDSNEFSLSKAKVSIICSIDENEFFIEQIKEVFIDSMTFVDISNDEKTIDDALFFRAVDCVVYLPDNFLNAFLDAGEKMKVECIEDSQNSIYFEMQMDKYLRFFKTYSDTTAHSIEEIAAFVKADISTVVETSYLQKPQNSSMMKLGSTMNFNAFPISLVTILCVVNILMTFNRKELVARNTVSSYSLRKFNAIKYLCCALLALIVFIIQSIPLIVMYGSAILSPRGSVMLGIMLLFAFVFLSFGFMLGAFIKNQNVLSGIVNVVTLPMCFISGVMVPQVYLPSGVLMMGRFTPAFWYVESIDLLAQSVILSSGVVWTIIINCLVLVSFMVAFAVVGGVISSHKRKFS